MNAFDTLEQQLRNATRRRFRRRARRAWRFVPAAAITFAAVLMLVLVHDRSPRPSDEREATTPAPSATWSPVVGANDRGHPSIARSPVPPEQAAAFAVLRRPQSRADRSTAVQDLLRTLSAHVGRGVRVDAVRLLQRRSNGVTILVPIERFHRDPRDPKDDLRDALCLIAGDDAGSGMTCGSLADALRGRMRWTIPPAGLAPDGAAQVSVRVRGGKTITAAVHNNYYDLHRAGTEQYAGIARPRWFDAGGHELHPHPAGG